MFGYVRPNLEALSEEEKARYNAVYCGLCRTLERKYGMLGRMSLTYDMTFLTLLLSSLYEPEERTERNRCPAHPGKAHDETSSVVTAYCADMTVALMYHKFLDDWHDDKRLLGRGGAAMLKKSYAKVAEDWPRQCAAIEACMRALSAIEADAAERPDAAAGCFGQLMRALMLWREDFWSGALAALGESLGRFVYMMDAAIDYEGDVRKGRYNPLTSLRLTPENARPLLEQTLGPASQIFEELPLLQDAGILRNTLYSGLWQVYNAKVNREEKTHEGSV